MGPERLDRARTVESIAAVPAPGWPPWAGAVLVRYPPQAAGLAAGATVCGPHTACRARRRSRYRETAPPWFRPPWPRSRACRFRPWIRVRSRRLHRATPRPSASPHDRRSRNRPETAPRVQRSPLPSNWLFEVSRRGSESRSLALVPAARKAPASFSRRRARFWRRQRARSVTFCLWTAARIDAQVFRGSGLDLRDVFPTGCVEGRAERAARSPGRGLRGGAELDRSRPQPVVDGVERFDQLVVEVSRSAYALDGASDA